MEAFLEGFLKYAGVILFSAQESLRSKQFDAACELNILVDDTLALFVPGSSDTTYYPPPYPFLGQCCGSDST